MSTIGLFSLVEPIEPKKVASPKAKIPPSEATSQYPFPVRVGVMPTIGWLSGLPPIEPKNLASPKEKMPPSDATIQYPRPVGVGAMPTIGWLRGMFPVDPKKWFDPEPYQKMPPSLPTSQYPEVDRADAGGAAGTAATRLVRPARSETARTAPTRRPPRAARRMNLRMRMSSGTGGWAAGARGELRLPLERTTSSGVTPAPTGRTRCYQSCWCDYGDGGFRGSSPSWRILRRFSHCSVRNTRSGTRTKSISSQPP